MGELGGFALLAMRLPILISKDPWIMGAGILIAVIYVFMRLYEYRARARDVYRGGLPDVSGANPQGDEIGRLVSDARYRVAVALFAEATRQHEREPLVPATRYLVSQGVPSNEARMNLIRIIMEFHSEHQGHAAPAP